MALKKDYVSATGLECKSALIRVEQVSLNRTGMTTEVSWKRDDSTPEFLRTTHEVPYNMNGANPIKQAYVHLKTLPEFAGAEDC